LGHDRPDDDDSMVLQRFIERILDDQEDQKNTISSRVSSFMVKLIPIANLALGFVSLGADVSPPEIANLLSHRDHSG
jgi:hypothetical protein